MRFSCEIVGTHREGIVCVYLGLEDLLDQALVGAPPSDPRPRRNASSQPPLIGNHFTKSGRFHTVWVFSPQSIHYWRSRRVRFAPKANNGQTIRRVHQDKGGLAAQ